MYRDHFGFKERPFTHAPGGRCFAATTGFTEAITRLQQVMTGRDSIAVLTGGPGVGKSTMAEAAIAALGERIAVARVDLRFGEPADIYAATLLAFDDAAGALAPVQALAALRRKMSQFGRDDRHLVLSLDISGISTDIAKHLLRLANLAGEHDCRMNIVLMGPHPLHQQLDVPALIQLRQRIAFRYRVRPLSLADTDRYIRQQLEAAGGDPARLASNNVSAAVYCYVAGVPRLVNTLLDAAFGDAALLGLERPDSALIRRTAETLGWKPMTPQQAPAEGGPKAAPGPGTRPAPVRTSAPPKVAVVSSTAAMERPRPAPPAVAASAGGDAMRAELPPPSEMTLQLRSGAGQDSTGQPAPLSLASEKSSPTAALFGDRDQARKADAEPAVAMDAVDTSATGMLRLQDLDERFAETIFGKDAR